MLGSPPKVIWLKIGNCSTDAIATLLRNAQIDIKALIEEDAETCLVLSFKQG